MCRHLLDNFSVVDVKRIVFTDEKDFTLEIQGNRQNDGVYGRRKNCDISIDRLYHDSYYICRGFFEWKNKEN